MQPSSRASLTSARERLDEFADSAAPDELSRLGEELFTVADLLGGEPSLRRSLADPAASESARRGLVENLLGEQVDRRTLDTLAGLVTSRWSRSRDLLDAIEELGRQAVFGVAERDGTLEEVEDELFRFGRILAAEPELATLLSDELAPDEQRIDLLGRLLDGKVQPVTERLLEAAVRSPRGRQLDRLAEQLVELAAARRDRYVAHVTAPMPLSEEQERRLVDALGRIYRRPISLQAELDPELLGGLVIRVGDEVIDGSLAARLDRARQWLPR